MTIGPGKYDDELTEARKNAKAKGAILIIYEGKYGDGFSCQLPLYMMRVVPSVLRQVADQIELEIKANQF